MKLKRKNEIRGNKQERKYFNWSHNYGRPNLENSVKKKWGKSLMLIDKLKNKE